MKNIKTLNEPIIRRSYDLAVENAARLYAYCVAATEKRAFSSDISDVMQELAHKDLLAFAIAARRLITATAFVSDAKESQIHSHKIIGNGHDVSVVNSSAMSFWNVLNYIIHSEQIDLYYESAATLYAFGHYQDDDFYEALVSDLGMRFSPIFFVKTDQKEPKLFSILELVSCFDVLAEKIIDMCADNRIHISSLYDN